VQGTILLAKVQGEGRGGKGPEHVGGKRSMGHPIVDVRKKVDQGGRQISTILGSHGQGLFPRREIEPGLESLINR